jgi:tRNA (cmo5U34)-methyltransferase
MAVKDRLFNKKFQKMIDFNFNKDTASVFSDMLNRSVPQYNEMLRMIGEIASTFAVKNTNCYDLGCSNGLVMEVLMKSVEKSVLVIGMDYSQAMLNKAKKYLGNKNRYKLVLHDLNDRPPINNASVIVLNLTLQFIRPLNRDKLIRSIYQGMRKGGCLILIEKILGNNTLFNRLFIEYYYNFKRRNGYSDMEISQKREALENVLIPYRLSENMKLLSDNGFEKIDVFMKWYNFCGIIAVK